MNGNLLKKNTKFSSFDGDLVLRGQFEEILGTYVNFYLNHIGVSISVNGEEVFWSGRIQEDIPEIMCAANWSSWFREEPKPEDIVEIRLHNPHSYGNAGAYNQFLDSMFQGPGRTIEQRAESASMPYRITGSIIIIVSIALLGVALSYFVQRLSSAGLLLSMGVMSLFMGIYMVFDTVDVEFHSELFVFNTCVRQYCIMFAVLELVNCIRKTLTGKRGKIAEVLAVTSGVCIGILLAVSLGSMIALYDTGIFWAVVHGLISLMLIGLCIQEYRQGEKENRILNVSYVILLLALLLKLVNARMNFWTSGIVVKVIFVLLAMLHIVRAIKLDAFYF